MPGVGSYFTRLSMTSITAKVVLAAAALSVPLRDLLAGEGWVRIADNVKVSLSTFGAALCSRRGAEDPNREAKDDMVRRRRPHSLESRAIASGHIGEVEYRTAWQLGVDPSRSRQLRAPTLGPLPSRGA